MHGDVVSAVKRDCAVLGSVGIHGDDGIDVWDIVVPAEPAMLHGRETGEEAGSGGGSSWWEDGGEIGNFVLAEEGGFG